MPKPKRTTGNNNNSPTAPRMVQAAARAQQAVDLRKKGLGYQAIADQVGLRTRQAAYQIVCRAMKRIRKETSESAEQLKQMELDRLDALLAANWSGATRGNVAKGKLVLSVMAQIDKLLGLNAPTKQELTGKDGGPVVIEAFDYNASAQSLAPAELEAEDKTDETDDDDNAETA